MARGPEPGKGPQRVATTDFAEFTDQDGQAILSDQDLKPDYQWLTVARTDAGRLAFVGFSNVWHPGFNAEPDQAKLFVITDRPVYRPGQPVKFKCWVHQARYEGSDDSSTARHSFRVQLYNPKGEPVFEHEYQSDDYGGFDGEYTPPKDATLGTYSLQVPNLGAGSFRVEEYKKPEFEVSVDAPGRADPARREGHGDRPRQILLRVARHRRQGFV